MRGEPPRGNGLRTAMPTGSPNRKAAHRRPGFPTCHASRRDGGRGDARRASGVRRPLDTGVAPVYFPGMLNFIGLALGAGAGALLALSRKGNRWDMAHYAAVLGIIGFLLGTGLMLLLPPPT